MKKTTKIGFGITIFFVFAILLVNLFYSNASANNEPTIETFTVEMERLNNANNVYREQIRLNKIEWESQKAQLKSFCARTENQSEVCLSL